MYVKIIAFFPLFLHVHNKWLSVQFIGIFFSFLRSSTISVTECTTNFFTSPEMNYSYSLSALSSYFVLCPNTQNRNASFIIGCKLRGILRNGNSLCFYGFVHFAHFATTVIIAIVCTDRESTFQTDADDGWRRQNADNVSAKLQSSHVSWKRDDPIWIYTIQ